VLAAVPQEHDDSHDSLHLAGDACQVLVFRRGQHLVGHGHQEQAVQRESLLAPLNRPPTRQPPDVRLADREQLGSPRTGIDCFTSDCPLSAGSPLKVTVPAMT
jgi:hypothetical protein